MGVRIGLQPKGARYVSAATLVFSKVFCARGGERRRGAGRSRDQGHGLLAIDQADAQCLVVSTTGTDAELVRGAAQR